MQVVIFFFRMSHIREKNLQANIWKYYLLRLFSKKIVWPIWTIFLIKNNLSVSEVGIIFSVGTILGLLLEIPSGAISDRIGRKASLVISFGLSAFAMFIFWLGDSFSHFFIANVIYVAAGSFWSGTHDAFIYETLQELGREKEIKKISGRATSISNIGIGFFYLLIGFMVKYSLHLPYLINGIIFGIMMVVVLSVLEPHHETSAQKQKIGENFFGVKEFFTHKTLFITGLVFAAIAGVSGILSDFRQVYLDDIQVSVVYFGIIFFVLRMVIALLAANTERIEKHIGKKATFLLIPFFTLFPYIILSFLHSTLGIVFLLMDGLADGLSKPLEQEYLNRFISNSQRATILSVIEFIENLIRSGAVFFAGFIIEYGGINRGFLFGAILTVAIFPLIFSFLKVAEKEKLFV